jgi:hypothetical protein
MGQSLASSMVESQKTVMREIQNEMAEKNYEMQVRGGERFQINFLKFPKE